MTKDRKNRWLVLGYVLIFTIPTVSLVGYLVYPYTWGRDGSLAITLSLERTTMPVNESINFTITLTNSGATPVRVFMGYYLLVSRLLDENNRTPDYFGPRPAPLPPLDDNGYNSAMRTIGPGRFIEQRGSYLNHSGTQRYHDLQPGRTYHIVAAYACSEERGFPVLPHWMGEVRTEPQYFSVLP